MNLWGRRWLCLLTAVIKRGMKAEVEREQEARERELSDRQQQPFRAFCKAPEAGPCVGREDGAHS